MITLIQSLWTIVVMVTFLGIVFWAYSDRRKASFDEAARLPLEDERLSPPGKNSTEQPHGRL